MSRFVDRIIPSISKLILQYLDKSAGAYQPFAAPNPDLLQHSLRPGDVLLIEGNTRLSGIIKYLTQSTWSHATLYVGPQRPGERTDGSTSDGGHEPLVLLEALADRGVVLAPLSKYDRFNTRICRPTGLSEADRQKVVDYALGNLGRQYDASHIVDLLRYLFPYPPVPVSWRRRMLAIGSGDPTKAICSTLIAASFYSVRYPILPAPIAADDAQESDMHIASFVDREIFHIKQTGLFTPRDFDVSPYFDIVKPILQTRFDYHRLIWRQD